MAAESFEPARQGMIACSLIPRAKAGEPVRMEDFPMRLKRGEVLGYDFDRMVVNFTMANHETTVVCAITTAAMDELEGTRDVKSDERVDQFVRLRDSIEERASRKFFEGPGQVRGLVVLRSNDFGK
jgi:hypothetical protein